MTVTDKELINNQAKYIFNSLKEKFLGTPEAALEMENKLRICRDHADKGLEQFIRASEKAEDFDFSKGLVRLPEPCHCGTYYFASAQDLRETSRRYRDFLETIFLLFQAAAKEKFGNIHKLEQYPSGKKQKKSLPVILPAAPSVNTPRILRPSKGEVNVV